MPKLFPNNKKSEGKITKKVYEYSGSDTDSEYETPISYVIFKSNFQYMHDKVADSMILIMTSRSMPKEELFSYADALETSDEDIEQIPETLKAFEYENRFIAKFNLHKEQVKELVERIASKWHGKVIYSPEVAKESADKLRENLLAIHVDVKNAETNKWERFETLDPKSLKYSNQVQVPIVTFG